MSAALEIVVATRDLLEEWRAIHNAMAKATEWLTPVTDASCHSRRRAGASSAASE